MNCTLASRHTHTRITAYLRRDGEAINYTIKRERERERERERGRALAYLEQQHFLTY